MVDKARNVFAGEEALRDYLDPDASPWPPLVELPTAFNPWRAQGVRLYMKLMSALPLHNIKSWPAFNMLATAEAAGQLQGVETLVENSSGNTSFSLAVLARQRGIPCTKAIVSHEVSPGKLKLLRLFGAEVVVNQEPICPDPHDPTSGIYKAKVWAQEWGWFNAGQYDNVANPAAHARWTGPQIWEQTQGAITLFAAALGTTGTLVGCAEYLKRQAPHLGTVGVVRQPNNPVPGPRTLNLLEAIAFDWRAQVDQLVEVGTLESYRMSMRLCRAGLAVGPSSGLALVGLHRYLESLSPEQLAAWRGPTGEVVAVTVACDTPYPYLDDYFEYLPAEDFPPIQHPEWLQTSPPPDWRGQTAEVTVNEAYQKLFVDDPAQVWDQLTAGEDPARRDRTVVWDIRPDEEFNHMRIPGAERKDREQCAVLTPADIATLAGQEILVVCRLGLASTVVVAALRALGLTAYSIQGGMIEWSRLNYPRWRPASCVRRHQSSDV